MSVLEKIITGGINTPNIDTCKTASEKINKCFEKVDNLSGANIGVRTFMTPLFEVLGANFNDETGYYELSEIIDLSESDLYEILRVHILGNPLVSYSENKKVRTTFPIKIWNSLINGSMSNMFFNCTSLETIQFSNEMLQYGSSLYQFCSRNIKLRKIIGVVNCLNTLTNTTNAFTNCVALESLQLAFLRADITFSDSPKLDNTSILYMIERARLDYINTSIII